MLKTWWWWTWWQVAGAVLLLGLAALAVAQERPRETRVDVFDQHSNRKGYVIINNETGRVDAYDTRSRRIGGSGQITPPPAPSTPRGTTPSPGPAR